MEKYPSLHDAFHGKLNHLLEEGEMSDYVTSSRSVGANFGDKPRQTLEVLGDSFMITDPRDRLMGDCRKMNTSFAVANFLWSIDEDSTHDAILAYNKHGEKFLADDGKFQCAIPDRINTKEEGNLLKEVVRLLKDDPASRRAIIPFIQASDIKNEPLDFPCPSYAHFMVRNNKLDLIVGMRSQSLAGVFVYDAFMFTMMQEAVALELGVDLGKYIHISDSLHIYDNEIEVAKSITECDTRPEPMEAMSFSPISNRSVHEAEKLYRTLGRRAQVNDLYWDKLLGGLQVHD